MDDLSTDSLLFALVTPWADDSRRLSGSTPFAQVENESGRVEYRFTVELTQRYSSPLLDLPPLASGDPVAVDWSVRGDGANPVGPEDFEGNVFPSGTVAFTPAEVAAGITRKPISFVVEGDGRKEADELFLLELSNPSGGSSLYVTRAPFPQLAPAWVGTVVDPAVDRITGIPGVPMVGDGGPDRFLAAGRGGFTMQGNGGADDFVLAPARRDFIPWKKGKGLSDPAVDEIVDFRSAEGDRIVLDSSAFRGLDPGKLRVKTTDGWSDRRGDLRDLAARGKGPRILVKREGETAWLFYDSNGKEPEFGDRGGLFARCTLEVGAPLNGPDVLIL
ncbi:MAG: hypothetical protein VKJ66_07985 [Synechococcus sp.]|nr:hypothetical protein [Synechococcus sp.]